MTMIMTTEEYIREGRLSAVALLEASRRGDREAQDLLLDGLGEDNDDEGLTTLATVTGLIMFCATLCEHIAGLEGHGEHTPGDVLEYWTARVRQEYA